LVRNALRLIDLFSNISSSLCKLSDEQCDYGRRLLPHYHSGTTRL
jgi:hypothetical protein